MALSNSSLMYFLTDSLRSYTEDLIVNSRTNPVLCEMNGVKYSIHISSIHDSGNTRTNDDEERIQIRRTVIDEQRRREQAGIVSLFIGFFPEGETFTAWEPAHVFAQRPERGGSVYARWSHNSLARLQSVALRRSRSTNLGREVVTLAMRKEYPDTLFFSRRLSMQGDTELGLLLKNTLDALELPSDTWRLLMPDRMFAILRKKIFSV